MYRHFIFGYGSLVNTATHVYGQAHAATLGGWRRAWQCTKLRDLAYLSVVPDRGSNIQGVLLEVAADDPALAAREQAYRHVEVTKSVSHSLGPDIAIDVFAIAPGVHRATGPEFALMLSYIDVVVQGYYREFGEAGVAQFFETTGRWGARIIDDRAAPQYPRHQVLTPAETALTDHWLNALSAKME